MFFKSEKVCCNLSNNGSLTRSVIQRAAGPNSDGLPSIKSYDQISVVPLVGWMSAVRDHGSIDLDGTNTDVHERQRAVKQRADDDEEPDFPSK